MHLTLRMSMVALLAGCAAPKPVTRPLPTLETGCEQLARDSVYFEYQVDTVARRQSMPSEFGGTHGNVLAQFTVAATGEVIPASFRAVESSSAAATAAVRSRITQFRYTPAVYRGCPVGQVTQERVVF